MIRNAVFYVVLYLSTAFFSTVAVVCGLLGAGHASFDWVHRNWSRSLLRAAGVRVAVQGLEHLGSDRGRIMVANHQSYFDIWALMASVPGSLRFVAKHELSKIPLLSAAMRSAGHVFIDRDRATSAGDAIRAAGERLHAEKLTLVLFAEGTRSRDGRLGRFLRGSFRLAIEMQADLIPTAIDGGHHVFPPGQKRVRSGTISVRLSNPIALEGKDRSDGGALMAETRATIASMLGDEETVAPTGDRAPVGPRG